jgi:hypothetical protein
MATNDRISIASYSTGRTADEQTDHRDGDHINRFDGPRIEDARAGPGGGK